MSKGREEEREHLEEEKKMKEGVITEGVTFIAHELDH